MADISERLDKVSARISEEAFLTNKGLSNEVGIHVFCYDPEDELAVRAHFEKLRQAPGAAYRIIECDLYKIFLAICEEKRILKSIPRMEETKGPAFLKEKLRWRKQQGNERHCCLKMRRMKQDLKEQPMRIQPDILQKKALSSTAVR